MVSVRYMMHVHMLKNISLRFLMCARVCVGMRVCVCVEPCLQGEVEADALAAGLARLSGSNLQTRARERERREAESK